MINNFHKVEPSLARLSNQDLPEKIDKIVFNEPVCQDEKSQLFDLVFAPDSSGFPSSDLAINAETLRDPGVQQFVNDTLRKTHQPTLQSFDDNEVLDSVFSRHENPDDYATRRFRDLSEQLKDDDDDKD